MQQKTRFYIGGAWTKPASSRTLDIIDPATEEPFAVIALANLTDVDRAVAAARDAFPAYSATGLQQRLNWLDRLRDVCERRQEELAQTISMEMGAPIRLARRDQATAGPKHIRACIEALKGFTFDYDTQTAGERIVHEPIGVCGLITPWNWPINQIALKVAPALAAGCTVVLKPSEIAPLSAMLFAELVDEAGFPPGVFNLINGTGAGAGEALAAHAGVDMISLTGSTHAGSAVTRAAAATVKKVTLELGGKSPNIIFGDADVRAAAELGVRHCFRNSGQSCNAPTRMLVERSVYDEAVAIAATAAGQTRVGLPSWDGDHIGPLASKTQFDKVQSFIETAMADGARLIAGGPGRPAGFNRGFFVKPTVFADVDNSQALAQREVFGPVLAIMPFQDEVEAVSIANDTPYGLAAYLHTSDPAKAQRVARQLRAGMISINGTRRAAESPFGGYRQSGNGREGGRWGLAEFLETKVISGCQAA